MDNRDMKEIEKEKRAGRDIKIYEWRKDRLWKEKRKEEKSKRSEGERRAKRRK